MGQYSVENREYAPISFFAGDFPTMTDTGEAAGEIKERMPVILDASGKIAPVTEATVQQLTGIAAMNAAEGEPCVFYQTGEFFANALVLPSEVTVDAIKEILRSKSIFLR